MLTNNGKRIIFFALFSLFLVCSQTASAQNKILEQNLSGELDQPAAQIEKLFAPDESFEAIKKRAASAIKYNFRSVAVSERRPEFNGSIDYKPEKFSFQPERPTFGAANDAKDDASTEKGDGFNYRGAFTQSLLFLGVQHGYAIGTQTKTRRDLKHGAFFRDYARSVKSLHGWDDGGRFFTNYIAHPMQGSLNGFIYVQNSPQASRRQFGKSSDYWKSRLKAMAWTAAWSTQFELGPVSQASIGNVGLHGKQTWGDIVVTPTFGTAMLVAEDAVDRYITRRIERRANNFYVKIFARMLLNPTRNFSNMLRFKAPWYRDRPAARKNIH